MADMAQLHGNIQLLITLLRISAECRRTRLIKISTQDGQRME